tara:strand:+ start:2249 stop:2434 length:186 start_codon:yes stop_codon:yes gene_type:complete
MVFDYQVRDSVSCPFLTSESKNAILISRADENRKFSGEAGSQGLSRGNRSSKDLNFCPSHE